MPQFDPTTVSPQLIWLAITFIVLYVLMAKVALPRIGQVLERRQHRIEENLKKAEILRSEAETAAAAYEEVLADARSKAHGILRQVREEMAADAAERTAAINARLLDEIAAAEARIGEAKKAAMADIRGVTAEVTRAASQKLMGDAPDEATVNAAIDAVLAERG